MYMGGSNMGMLNSNLIKLGSFLGNEKLFIPVEYQRGYSWEETQLDDFWIDLIEIYQEKTRDEHFLGQVVIHKNKEDGKTLYYRWTTTYLYNNYFVRYSTNKI